MTKQGLDACRRSIAVDTSYICCVAVEIDLEDALNTLEEAVKVMQEFESEMTYSSPSLREMNPIVKFLERWNGADND